MALRLRGSRQLVTRGDKAGRFCRYSGDTVANHAVRLGLLPGIPAEARPYVPAPTWQLAAWPIFKAGDCRYSDVADARPSVAPLSRTYEDTPTARREGDDELRSRCCRWDSDRCRNRRHSSSRTSA